MKVPPQDLKKLLSYNSRTGVFTWKINRGRARKGAQAGYKTVYGYRGIEIRGVQYLLHRIAWFYIYGYCPDNLDHKDGRRDNNRIKNLREASHLKNSRNMKRRGPLPKGVTKAKVSAPKSFQARIRVAGKRISLGFFATPKSAHDAYREAATKYFGEFARFE